MREILDIMLADNRQAWELGSDGAWTQRHPAAEEPERSSQTRLLQLAIERQHAIAKAVNNALR